MLRRQRTVLSLLAVAGRPVNATQIQKYLFLLKQETFLTSDSAFYDFLPYRFGPYSFSAHRETEALIGYGYINEASSGSATPLTLTPLGLIESATVDKDTTRAVRFILSKSGSASTRDLLEDVYNRYPWFASNSEYTDLISADRQKRKAAEPAVYTMGYEDRSVDGFFNALLSEGIGTIIDVRANPVSRKYGFARSAMSGIAKKLGIEYMHVPELGIASEKRKGLQSKADFRQLFKYYESQIIPQQLSKVESVAARMQAGPSVLICMEREAVNCHRGRLAQRISQATGMAAVHL